MDLLNIKIHVGDSADTALTNTLPTGISSFYPYIQWQLPKGIEQKKFKLEIKSLNNSSLIYSVQQTSDLQWHQIPNGSVINNDWIGVCFIEIQISEDGNEFKYTSGSMDVNKGGYFVIDTTIQNLSSEYSIQYLWQKSIDLNVDQTLTYSIQVSKHPIFGVSDIIFEQNNISDVKSGFVSFLGQNLDYGIYFYRVKSYDGIDYSQWSKVNVFKILHNPPIIKQLSCDITDNEFGDVIISFTTQSQCFDYTSVVLTYSYDDNPTQQFPCSIRQTSHVVPVGRNHLTWISSQNIKCNGGFFIYAFAYENGLYSKKIFTHIVLNNQKYVKTNSTVSDVNLDFVLSYISKKQTKIVYYTYVGWDSQIPVHNVGCQCPQHLIQKQLKNKGIDTILNSETEFKCQNCSKKADCIIWKGLRDNNVYCRVITSFVQPKQELDYIGWNSQIDLNYIQPKIKDVEEKYLIANTPFSRLLISGDTKDFSVYADGRNFCRIDKQQYMVYKEKQETDSFSVTGETKEKQVILRLTPPYQKPASFDPIFKEVHNFPFSDMKDRQEKSISIENDGNVNWTYYLANMDWTFYAKQTPIGSKQQRTVYIKVWGGQFSEKAEGKDKTLSEIQKIGSDPTAIAQSWKKIYQAYNKQFSSFTLSDGKLFFQDQHSAPQYTMYPNVYGKTGYPVSISQKYWKFIKLDDLYIKKYYFQKGHSQKGQYGYKDFTVKKRNNYYHRFFNDLMIPQFLILKNNGEILQDQNSNVCYKKTNDVYMLVSKIYSDLPQTIAFDSEKQHLMSNSEKLYFQQYLRKNLNYRGKEPERKEGEEKELSSPFSNIAVPKYVKAKQVVYSSNQFNGRSHVFGVKTNAHKPKDKTEEQSNRVIFSMYKDDTKIVERNLIGQGTKLFYNTTKKQNYFSDKSQTGISDYKITGNLSDVVQQKFKQKTVNQYLSLNRIVYLNHKNVIKDSVFVYYINEYSVCQQNDSVSIQQITNFKFVQSSSYYNAYVVISQDSDYLDKQIYISYKYIITDQHFIDTVQSNVITFNSYQDAILFNSQKIDSRNFYLKDENGDYIDKKYYFLQKEGNKYTKLSLSTYFHNVPIEANYNYKQLQLEGQSSISSQSGSSVSANPLVSTKKVYLSQFKLIDDKYVFDFQSSKEIVQQSFVTQCYQSQAESQNINHKIQKFEIGENQIIVTQKKNISNMRYAPILLKYYYKLLLDGSFQIIFNGYSTYLSRLHVNVQTIKIYYTLSNGVDHYITDYFQFRQDGITPVTSGYCRNILIMLKKETQDQDKLDQVFSNRLTVSYDGRSQQLYLSLQSIKREQFSKGFDYELYSGNTLIQKSNYMIVGDSISLVANGSYSSVVPYLYKNLTVKYKYYQDRTGQLRSGFSFYSSNSSNSDSSVGSCISESSSSFSCSVKLNNNIIEETFSAYSKNDFLQLKKIHNNDFYLDSRNGIFVLKNEQLSEQRLFFIYKYRNQVQRLSTKQFKSLDEKFYLENNFLIDTVSLYYFLSSSSLSQSTINSSDYLEKKILEKDVDYSVSEEGVVQLKRSDLLNVLIYISYFCTGQLVLSQYSNVLTQQNNVLNIKEKDIQIDFYSVNKWQVYYQKVFDVTSNIYLSSDSSNSSEATYSYIVEIPQQSVKKSNQVYVLFSYNNFIGETRTYQQNIIFNNLFEKILLTKQYCYNIQLKLIDLQEQIINQKDFEVQNGKQTYVYLTNRYLKTIISAIYYKLNLIDQYQSQISTLIDNVIYVNKNNIDQSTLTLYYSNDKVTFFEISKQYYDTEYNNMLTFVNDEYIKSSENSDSSSTLEDFIQITYNLYTSLKSKKITINNLSNNIIVINDNLDIDVCQQSVVVNYIADGVIFVIPRNHYYLTKDYFDRNIVVIKEYYFDDYLTMQIQVCFDTHYKQICKQYHDVGKNPIQLEEHYIDDQQIDSSISSLSDSSFSSDFSSDSSSSTSSLPVQKTHLEIYYNSIVVKRYRNGVEYEIPQNNYIINKKYYLNMDNVIFDLYFDKTIKVEYKYFDWTLDNSNKNISYLKFQKYANKIYLNHNKSSERQLYFYNINQWQLIPEQHYKYSDGAQLSSSSDVGDSSYSGESKSYPLSYYASITLPQNSDTNKYFGQKLKLNYYVQHNSQLCTISFKNDRSIVFKDKSGYIVLQHNYVDKSTVVIYCQTDEGIVVVPKQAYLIDVGNESYNAVISLNKDYSDLEKYINKRIVIYYRYVLDPIKTYNKNNQKFPYLDFIFKHSIANNSRDYQQGYPIDQHDAYFRRNQPTYSQGRGIRLITYLNQNKEYSNLNFLYLQSFWDAYNTIHIGGNLDKYSRIVLQYGQLGQDGIVLQNKFKDLITFNSVFYKQINHYLITPLIYDVFVNTFDESVFIQNQPYVLRMRIYNLDTQTFTSQWKYSGSFVIDHESVNPVNITNISYDPWTKICTIQFRIDDTQGDYYDLISYYYTNDGVNWKKIENSDIDGAKQYLTSNKKDQKKIIYHRIYWDVSSYGLVQSSSYRIKINATYTKYNLGDTPSFYWQCFLNPLIDYYQSQLLQLNGGKQYMQYVTETYRQIKNSDGTFSYQQLQTPISYWKKVQPYQYVILDKDGNPIGTQIRDYMVVQGQLQQKQNKMQEIKGRPQKVVIQNGVAKTINWGYLQYCDSNGVIFDTTGYLAWLRGIDSVYNQVRQVLLNQLQSQIDQINKKITNYNRNILLCQMQNRRCLIRQGFYTSGLIGNSEENFDFPFRLRSKSISKYENDWISIHTENKYYQFRYNFQLDFYQTFDSQYNAKPLRDIYQYLYSQQKYYYITAGINKQNDDTNLLYYGNFTLDNNTLPGKLKTDQNVIQDAKDFSYSYYWKIRPYFSFYDVIRQIVRCKIYSMRKSQDSVFIQFSISAQKAIGIVKIYPLENLFIDNPTLLYKQFSVSYQKKSSDKKIALISPVVVFNSYSVQSSSSSGSYSSICSESSTSESSYGSYSSESSSSYSYNDQFQTQEQSFHLMFDQNYNESSTSYQSESSYSSFSSGSRTVNSSQNVDFLTDRLRNDSGYVINRTNGYKNWISFESKRQRPQVIIFQNEYYMFYDKPGMNQNNLIYLALSKNGSQFGQHSQIYPYCAQDDIYQLTNKFLCMKNNFTIRYENKFCNWFSTIVEQDNVETKQIAYIQSDFYGNKFKDIWQCTGLNDCDCPSVFVCKFFEKPSNYSENFQSSSSSSESSYQKVEMQCFVMLCLKDLKFQFFMSTDKINWVQCKTLKNYQFVDAPNVYEPITKDQLQYKEESSLTSESSSSFGTCLYLSPFLYKQEDTNDYYLYYCEYNLSSNESKILRIKYNYTTNNWDSPQKILDGGFNPTVVQDYFFGNKYHRLYYNVLENKKIDGQFQNDIVIKNCYITKDIDVQQPLRTVRLQSVSSQQIQLFSKTDMKYGDYQKCQKCLGTGKITNKLKEVHDCQRCNGLGYLKQIFYTYSISKSNFPSDFNFDKLDEYNFYINFQRVNSKKQYRSYGDWYDYDDASNLSQKITPENRWRYLQI